MNRHHPKRALDSQMQCYEEKGIIYNQVLMSEKLYGSSKALFVCLHVKPKCLFVMSQAPGEVLKVKHTHLCANMSDQVKVWTGVSDSEPMAPRYTSSMIWGRVHMDGLCG